MKYLTVILLFLLALALIYFVAAWLALDWDPTKWGAGWKVLVAVAVCSVTVTTYEKR